MICLSSLILNWSIADLLIWKSHFVNWSARGRILRLMADLTQLLGRTLVLVAHPDDETAGCGGLLQRIAEPIVVFATDGAPRDRYFWDKYDSRLRYQRVREEEARAAMSTIGVSEIEFLGAEPRDGSEGICDQELYLHLADAVARVSRIAQLRRPQAILTLAYEGGHPDHDSCSIIAARVGAQYQLKVWEFPLYSRPSSRGIQYLSFLAPDPNKEVAIELTSAELANKQAMLQAYASQHPFVLWFDPKVERFRPQRNYDYTRPPHTGKLNYEAWKWPMTGADVCAAYCRFAANHSAVGPRHSAVK